VSGSLTTLVILVTLIHVAALVVMIVIRVRRTSNDGPESANSTPCAVCGAPATHRSYDGLDLNEQRDPHTGRSWSTDLAHYPPRCAVH